MKGWLNKQGEAVYLVAAGLLLLLAAWGAVVKHESATSSVLALVSGGALIAAPFASRLQGRFRIGSIEMNIRERVVERAATAPITTLAAVLPLLEGDGVSVRQIDLPPRLAGHTLIDAELAFIRKELHLSVIAVRLPAETSWRAGGQVSELQFPPGTSLLVAGPPDAIEKLASTS